MPGSHLHAVDHPSRADVIEYVVDEVDRTGCRGTCRDDGIGGRVLDLIEERLPGIGNANRWICSSTEMRQPGRDQWTQRIAHSAGSRQAALEEFIAEDKYRDGGRRNDVECVVAGCRGQPQHRRSDNRSGRHEGLTFRALLAARADIRARCKGRRGVFGEAGQGVERIEPRAVEGGLDAGELRAQDGVAAAG